MYLKSKKIAFLGLLTALSVVLIIFSGIFEFSTLFFLCIAAACVGIAIYEAGVVSGCCLFVASVILGILLAPNKMYCFTYSALSVYIIAIEATLRIVEKKIQDRNQRNRIVLPLKFVYFNAIYLPILFFLPKLIYSGTFSPIVYGIAIVGGQVVFYLFDRIYFGFINYYGSVLRNRFHING